MDCQRLRAKPGKRIYLGAYLGSGRIMCINLSLLTVILGESKMEENHESCDYFLLTHVLTNARVVILEDMYVYM